VASLEIVIAHLRGHLLDKQPNRLIVDVQGVGYEVQVPLSTFYDVGEPGAEIALQIHTHVREDTLALFGFLTMLELQLFEKLIGITGIGPKLALVVLSGIEPRDLVTAIRRGDVARLIAIPGIGKKTAERMSLELKDRLPASLGVGAASHVASGSDLREDVVSALLNLGYHRPLAERAVDSGIRNGSEGNFEHTLKQALRELAKG
jgi:holliday junction DNA helicase RuvA